MDSNKKALVIILVIVFALAAFGLFTLKKRKGSETSTEKLGQTHTLTASNDQKLVNQRRISYSFDLQNQSGDLLQDTEVRMFSPIKQASGFITAELKVSEPYTMLSDQLGNQILQFKVTVPPYSTKIITIDALLSPPTSSAKDESKSIELGHNDILLNNDIFLKDENSLELANPKIVQLAKELSPVLSNSDKAQPEMLAKNVLDWIDKNVEAEQYVKRDRGALFALEHGKGDCTELTQLFVALMRINAVPTRMLGGFVLDKDARINASAYHNWAEFFNGKVWKVADPSNNVLGENQANYLAFRVIAASEIFPLSDSQRFLSFDRRLKVKLN